MYIYLDVCRTVYVCYFESRSMHLIILTNGVL
jgi:hypothetical protein